MTISGGSHTVGSGGTYATLNAALADVVTLTADLTFTIISSFTETVPLANNFSIDVATFNILIDSDAPHNGVLGAGHIITLDTDLDINFGNGGTVDSGTEIKNLQWKYGAGSFLDQIDIRMDGCNLDFHDNIFDMAGGTNRTRVRLNVPTGTAVTVDVYNNLFYNDATDSNAACLQIDAPTASAATFTVQNNVMDARDAAAFAGGLSLSIDVTATALIANNVMMAQDRSLDNGATYPAGALQNNACSDSDSLNGTTSPIQGFTPSVEFVSDVYGEFGYLQTALGQQFELAGVANSLTTVDMRGESYGASPPIGSYTSAVVVINKFWIAATLQNASNNNFWSLTSGGANDTTAPTIADTVNFDGGGLGDCTFDIAQVAEILIDTLYTGDVDQSVEVFSRGDITILSASAEWDTAGNDFYVDGDVIASVGGAVRHRSGGTFFVGGNANLDYSSSNVASSLVVFHHSKATPTTAKTHDLTISGGNERMEDIEFVANQTARLLGNWLTTIVNWGANTGLIDDDISIRTITVEGLWVNTLNCNIQPTGTGKLVVKNLAVDVDSAVYTDCNVSFLNFNAILTGSYTAMNRCRLRTDVDGQQEVTLTGTGAIASNLIEIGHISNTGRCTRFIQESGSSFNATGNVIVTQDNTILENIWERQAGVLDTLIGGELDVRSDSELDWFADSSTITVNGNITIPDDSDCHFGNTVVVSPLSAIITCHFFNNKFKTLSVAFPGQTTTFSNINRMDFVIFNGGEVTTNVSGDALSAGIGVFDEHVITNLGPTTFTNSGGFWLNVGARGQALGVNTVDGMDLGGGDFNVNYSAGTVRILGDMICDDFDVQNGIGDTNGFTVTTADDMSLSDATLLLNGSIINVGVDWRINNAGATVIAGTGAGVINIGGDLEQTNGNVDLSGVTINVDGNHTITSGDTFNLGTGIITTLGNFIPPSGNVDLGSGTYKCEGDFDMTSATSIAYGTSTVELQGSNAQDVEFDSAPHNVTVSKPAGLVDFLDAWIATGPVTFIAHPLTTAIAQFLALGAYGGSKLTSEPLNGSVLDSERTKIRSSNTTISQFNYTAASNNGALENLSIADLSYLSGEKVANIDTCDIVGNTVLSPPAPGINLTAIIPPSVSKPSGLGLNLGITIP